VSWIESIATYLDDQGVATIGTDLFVGFMPDADGTIVLLSESEGAIMETQGTALAVQKPQFQVMTVGDSFDYVNPKNKIEQIQSLLANLSNVTLSGVEFLSIRPQGTINALGQDDNQAFQFTANFEVTIV
jgi:kynurenine formamidase